MKCYFHTDKDAVSVCEDCKKSLCKECYDLGYNGLCEQCLKKRRLTHVSQEKHYHERNHKLFLRRSHYALLIGLIVGICTCVFLSQSTEFWEIFKDRPEEISVESFERFFQVGAVVLTVAMSYSIFAMYAGCSFIYRVIDKILSLGFILIVAWPVLLGVLMFASFLGVYIAVPLYIYHLVQHRRGKKKFAQAKEAIIRT